MSRFQGKHRSGRTRAAIRLLVVAVLAAATIISVRIGVAPEVGVESALPGFGQSTPVEVTATAAGRGLARVRVSVRQEGLVETLVDKTYESRPAWAFWGPRTVVDSISLAVGSETIPRLQEGTAVLEVEASSPGTWIRDAPGTTIVREFPVILRPPVLSVASTQHYPAQGGAEVVVYRVGKTAVRDGVRAGRAWFPGYQLPGGSADMRFSLFAVPFDLDDPDQIRLEAEDILGNTSRAAFVDKFFPRPFKTDDINVSDRFMAKVVPEIQANTPGLVAGNSLLDDYVSINRDLRSENAQTLRDLASASRQEFLWNGRFEPLPNAKVMSAFADRRTYLYDGQVVDHQDHLGFDLASVRRAPIPAANSGVVVLARYFGIYGNAVVIDHGYGLFSLYGHLSAIDVEEGQVVEAGTVVGKTGETGLAAGDHLHFTMLLHGEAVNPVEWWDRQWIRDRLKRKLGAALPLAE